MIKRTTIEELAHKAGFDICGVTRAEHLPQGEAHFREWLSNGYGDGLNYLHRNQELRFDATKLCEGARTIVVCGVNYKCDEWGGDEGAKIASYALMRDYHKTIKRKLKLMLRELQAIDPTIDGRFFTDSAPLLEKHLAVRAGLGWIGRQSLLVTPQFGTFVLLGELVLSCEVDSYNETLIDERCGGCRLCVESCPASAINENRTIDTRRCIACRTIEYDNSGDAPLAGWIFGCDICQRCCPHNQRTPATQHEDMRRIVSPLTEEQWSAMEQNEYEEYTQGTPMRRGSIERIKRHLEINRRDKR